MKKVNIFLMSFLAISVLFMGCEKNDFNPDWTTIGTSNPTVASVAASKTSVTANETITLTVKYVNLEEDPASELEIVHRIGTTGSFSEVLTQDESSAPRNEEVTREITYTVPALTADATIQVDVLIYSQVEFPKRVRVALTATP